MRKLHCIERQKSFIRIQEKYNKFSKYLMHGYCIEHKGNLLYCVQRSYVKLFYRKRERILIDGNLYYMDLQTESVRLSRRN